MLHVLPLQGECDTFFKGSMLTVFTTCPHGNLGLMLILNIYNIFNFLCVIYYEKIQHIL